MNPLGCKIVPEESEEDFETRGRRRQFLPECCCCCLVKCNDAIAFFGKWKVNGDTKYYAGLMDGKVECQERRRGRFLAQSQFFVLANIWDHITRWTDSISARLLLSISLHINTTTLFKSHKCRTLLTSATQPKLPGTTQSSMSSAVK